jgi:hypothetical protein
MISVAAALWLCGICIAIGACLPALARWLAKLGS